MITKNKILIAGLVPCGYGNYPACDPCYLWYLAGNIVDFLLKGLALPILALALLIGGIVWLTSSGKPAQIEKGKNILTSSVIGIFIAFGAWLIVNTIINTLGQGKLTWSWESINACPAPIVTPSPIAPPPPITPPAGTFQTEEAARAYFQNTGIEINKSPCTAGQTTNCTDLKGLPLGAAAGLKALATSGGFCISGGTEGEGALHQTHGIGKPVVDIKPSCSGAVEIPALTALRRRASFLSREAICESQNGDLRSSKTSCLISNGGTPFTEAQLKQLNHIHVVFP
ncbi:MAG: hypothetical protein HYW15_01140 [Candidatus Giovannonibacteria bacterium]|nr:MAG: hypothetical protein HYW15_01140 [Candidatus Giovannonibacteria bacterium]